MGRTIAFLMLWGITVPLAWSSTSVERKNILLIGLWDPTSTMIRSFSPDKEKNPNGWKGENWEQSGYNVFAYFPTFANSSDRIGSGDFRIDFAAVYNDFMRITAELRPVAIIGYGAGDRPWEVEEHFPASFHEMFQSGVIPSLIGLTAETPIAESLKLKQDYRSTLPMEQIVESVNQLPIFPGKAEIDKDGPGTFVCGFLSYLLGWYHDQHADHRDPAHSAMAGFIHVGSELFHAVQAQAQTLATVIEVLGKQNSDPRPQVAMDALRSKIFANTFLMSR